MNEIPDDIRKAAQKAWDDAMVLTNDAHSEMVIAQAILAERDRCAAIAKEAADTFDKHGPLSLGSTAGDVWFRIRQGQAKEGESD